MDKLKLRPLCDEFNAETATEDDSTKALVSQTAARLGMSYTRLCQLIQYDRAGCIRMLPINGAPNIQSNEIYIDPDQVEVEGGKIKAPVDIWFDADKKFGVNTKGTEDWVNLYAEWDPMADELNVCYTIDKSSTETDPVQYVPVGEERRLFVTKLISAANQAGIGLVALDKRRAAEIQEAEAEGRVQILPEAPKPLVWGSAEHDQVLCPSCGSDLMGGFELDEDGSAEMIQCPHCGQFINERAAE